MVVRIPTPENSGPMIEKLRLSVDGRRILLFPVGIGGSDTAAYFSHVLDYAGIGYELKPPLIKGGYHESGEYRLITTQLNGHELGEDVVLLYDDISRTGKTMTGAWVYARKDMGARNVIIALDEDQSGISDIARIGPTDNEWLGPELYIWKNQPHTYEMLLDEDLIPDKDALEEEYRKILDSHSGEISRLIDPDDLLSRRGELPRFRSNEEGG